MLEGVVRNPTIIEEYYRTDKKREITNEKGARNRCSPGDISTTPTFLAGISAGGGDSQLQKQKHNFYFISTTAISLAQLQIST